MNTHPGILKPLQKQQSQVPPSPTSTPATGQQGPVHSFKGPAVTWVPSVHCSSSKREHRPGDGEASAWLPGSQSLSWLQLPESWAAAVT